MLLSNRNGSPAMCDPSLSSPPYDLSAVAPMCFALPYLTQFSYNINFIVTKNVFMFREKLYL